MYCKDGSAGSITASFTSAVAGRKQTCIDAGHARVAAVPLLMHADGQSKSEQDMAEE